VSSPVRVASVQEEYDHVHAALCACGGRLAVRGQRLMADAHPPYELLIATCPGCGAERTFAFDVSALMTARTKPPADRGPVTGVVKTLLYVVAFAAGLLVVLFVAGPPMQDAGPGEKLALGALGGVCAGVCAALWVVLRRKVRQLRRD